MLVDVGFPLLHWWYSAMVKRLAINMFIQKINPRLLKEVGDLSLT